MGPEHRRQRPLPLLFLCFGYGWATLAGNERLHLGVIRVALKVASTKCLHELRTTLERRFSKQDALREWKV